MRMAYFAPILSLLPFYFGGRKEASRKLSLEWKTLIWIGHYSTFIAKYVSADNLYFFLNSNSNSDNIEPGGGSGMATDTISYRNTTHRLRILVPQKWRRSQSVVTKLMWKNVCQLLNLLSEHGQCDGCGDQYCDGASNSHPLEHQHRQRHHI